MGAIGTERKIVEIPVPVAVPTEVPAAVPVEPAKVPVPVGPGTDAARFRSTPATSATRSCTEHRGSVRRASTVVSWPAP